MTESIISYNMTNEAYHADRTHISKSMLDALKKSPAHLKAQMTHPKEQTLAMEIGSMTHEFILQPDQFVRHFAIAPKFDRRTKQGKQDAEQWELENSGKKAITSDYQDMLNGMRDSLLAHREAYKLLSAQGDCEMSIFTTHLGVKCKIRPDKKTGNTIVDLKTCEDASAIGFSKSIANFRYHVQCAFYLDVAKSSGLSVDNFIFIAVEKEYPYAVATYQLDLDSIEAGRTEYTRQLDLYKNCLELDSWPAYGQTLETISLPNWIKK